MEEVKYVLIEVYRVKPYTEKSLILKLGAKWDVFIPRTAYGGYVKDNLHKVAKWFAEKHLIEYEEV